MNDIPIFPDSSSYVPADCCNSPTHCAYRGVKLEMDNGPCWGEVQPSEDLDDEGFLHTCEGHRNIWGSLFVSYPGNGQYKPEPPRS